MKKWMVSAGVVDYGVYEADSAELAIEACVREAGYESVEDMECRIGSVCKLAAVAVAAEVAA